MTSQKACQLVVSGDDGGAAPESDAALLRAFDEGPLRSVSVLANGLTTEPFAAKALARNLSVGLHINFSEGKALGGPILGLTNDRAEFPGQKQETWRRLAEGKISEAALAREITAQWEALVALGLRPDHVDGHNHVQMFPKVLSAMTLALGQESIFVRVPDEPECPRDLVPEFQSLSLSSAEFRRRLEGTAWRASDHFVGFCFSLNPRQEALAHLFPARPGLTEFMVHPGARCGSQFTESSLRDRELRTLLDETMTQSFQSAGYQLVSFREAQ
ncbi:MAG: ChbG/HpnK family deacetylase [Planctomycetota bacterium]